MVLKHRWTGPRLEGVGSYTFEQDSGVMQSTVYPYSHPTGGQVTSSEGHPYHKLGRDHTTDIGGSFETRKFSVELETRVPEYHWYAYPWPYSTYGYKNTYTGIPLPAYAIWNDLVDLSTTEASGKAEDLMVFFTSRLPNAIHSSELDALGASAVASTAPTSPVVDLSISLGEFVSERKFFAVPGTAGSVPGEYLNYMFGIAPTIADIRDLRTAVKDREIILKQYARDSGRLIRRRTEPEIAIDTVKTVYGDHLKYLGSTSQTNGAVTKVKRTTSKWWFSGAFTYYLPKEGIMRDVAELDRLYGVKPGAALAWELMPYSWLVDYKLSVGSALRNLDSFTQDGLVMPYGYVMYSQEIETTYTWTGVIPMGSSWVPRTYTGKTVATVKQRRPANPFGFGISPESLTLRQMSIIAALGLTKLDK